MSPKEDKMIDCIKMAHDAITTITEFENFLLAFVEQAMVVRFGHKKRKGSHLIDDMGGIRTLVQMLNGVRFPKGCTPVKVGCTPPIFEPATAHGVEAVKASFTVEIMAIKEDPDGKQ